MLEQESLYQKELGLAQWYVKNKILIKKIIIVLLIIFNVGLFAYNVNLIVTNLFLRQPAYQSALLSFVQVNNDFTRLRQFNLPKEIQIGQIETFANKEKTDIIAEISNVNSKWWASFDYQFKAGQASTDLRKGFILPGEQKKLIDLSVELTDQVNELVLSNIEWKKEINFVDIFQTTYNLEVRNITYVPVKELGLGMDLPVSQVNFEVDNLSAYNYRDVNFIILLDTDGQVVAINNVTSGKLLSGQSNKIEVNFFQQLPKISGVKVIPEINLLDQTSFLSI